MDNKITPSTLQLCMDYCLINWLFVPIYDISNQQALAHVWTHVRSMPRVSRDFDSERLYVVTLDLLLYVQGKLKYNNLTHLNSGSPTPTRYIQSWILKMGELKYYLMIYLKNVHLYCIWPCRNQTLLLCYLAMQSFFVTNWFIIYLQ